MRKFIVSDIHGFGNFYYSIMNYLDELSKEEEIELYINGDLIDRGNESVEILLDVIKRIEEQNPRFKIKYLGGNHELMMYIACLRKLNGSVFSPLSSWYLNSNDGKRTEDELYKSLNNDYDKISEVVSIIGDLNIYHKFDEVINNKQIILVHAASPRIVNDICDLKVKNLRSRHCLWAREGELLPIIGKIGNKNYFTIIGHTPNNYSFGYVFNKGGNYLNIDGGCAPYVLGCQSFNHFPLVEVKENYLRILTFNSQKEIIYGNYFDGIGSTPFTNEELTQERKKLI